MNVVAVTLQTTGVSLQALLLVSENLLQVLDRYSGAPRATLSFLESRTSLAEQNRLIVRSDGAEYTILSRCNDQIARCVRGEQEQIAFSCLKEGQLCQVCVLTDAVVVSSAFVGETRVDSESIALLSCSGTTVRLNAETLRFLTCEQAQNAYSVLSYIKSKKNSC